MSKRIGLIAFLGWKFGIMDIFDTLRTAPEGKSLLNPFAQGDLKNFNFGDVHIVLIEHKYGMSFHFHQALQYKKNQGLYCYSREHIS